MEYTPIGIINVFIWLNSLYKVNVKVILVTIDIFFQDTALNFKSSYSYIFPKLNSLLYAFATSYLSLSLFRSSG